MKSLVLKVLFFLLIVVALAELAYLFFRPRSPKSPASPTQVATETSPTPSSIPLPTVNMDTYRQCINIDEKARDLLDNSADYVSRKLADKAQIINEAQGEIVSFEVDNAEEPTKELGFYMRLQKDINGKKELFEIIINKDQLNNTKVSDQTGKTISTKDLKIGQTVKIVQTYDLKEKSNRYEIIVL